jgi:Transposase DDE domain group 1
MVTHSVADILRARMLAVACGCEDADDLDHQRTDPGFKLACGRLPDSGTDLCSQPTISRWENAPTPREVVRLTYAKIDTYCASYKQPSRTVTLDIDDTLDVVYAHQQLSLFNAHYDERCFLPIHVYDTATSRPVAVLLLTGTTPSGVEIRGHRRRMVRRIRTHWPDTRLTLRGDGHYGPLVWLFQRLRRRNLGQPRPEVMARCVANGLDYIFGLPGNAVLDRLVEPFADDIRVRRAEAEAPVVRRYCETRYDARSWRCERRVGARIEATTQGFDIRYVVTNIKGGSAEWLYDIQYCTRGQAENLIKLHKAQLASDRTSCRSSMPISMARMCRTASPIALSS